MKQAAGIWKNPQHFVQAQAPGEPVALFCPAALLARARVFAEGFAGLVSYAVKANPDEAVLSNLAAGGITVFDVASPWEMAQVRAAVHEAVLHYNNPVRTPGEIEQARGFDVVSYSVDCRGELKKLEQAYVPAERANVEVAVRFKLSETGATYDFGEKFGADTHGAALLLEAVRRAGFLPALSFHPGTQCHDAATWEAYIRAAGHISHEAGFAVSRLNVGGGFPSHRIAGKPPRLEPLFETIARETRKVFGAAPPKLVCEPGRAMVGDSVALLTQVKAIRDNGAVFLNDGLYGGFAEYPVIGPVDRVDVFISSGMPKAGGLRARTVFGPTCDSVDKLPDPVLLPDAIAEEDYVLFHGLGAYGTSLATRFNGYGVCRRATVESLTG